MKTFLKIMFIGTLFFSNILSAHASQAQSLDRIIVTVNDAVITQSELNQAIGVVKKQLQSSHAPIPPASVLHKQVLDQMINRKIQLQLAKQAGIKIDEAQVDAAINRIAKNNHITRQQLYSSVQAEGLSINEYRQELREEMMLQNIQQHEIPNPKLSVTAQEINDFMHSSAWSAMNVKEYHLQDMLIPLNDSPSNQELANARASANTLLKKLRNGEKVTSRDGMQSNDLGWRKVSEIPSAFVSKISNTKQNDVMGPIKTGNGFHLVKVLGVRQIAAQGTGMDPRRQAEQILYQRKFEKALKSWIAKLRSEAFINMNPDN